MTSGGAARFVGQSVARTEDARILTGGGRYMDDIVLPGMLEGAFVRSDLGHAQIASIDATRARSMPGVVAVITATELDGVVGPLRLEAEIPNYLRPVFQALADGKVRYVGDPIAFVVARRSGGGGERWLKTVRLDQLPDGHPRKVKIVSDVRDAWKLEKDADLGAVWLIRNGDTVHALSVGCPHLGCSVGATEDKKGFACPCHDSSFSIDGKRQDGPSPRDMDALATRISLFDKWAISNTKRLVNAASLPADVEMSAGWDACIASVERPATQARIKAFMDLGFHKPGDQENRIGQYLERLNR